MPIRVLAVLLLLAAVAVGVLVVRGSSVTTVEDVGPNAITVECTGWSGLGAESCGARGSELFAAGAPSTTFDNEDVVRIRLDRGSFGFAESCTATWFVSRYPDEPAWDEDVSCGA